MESDDGDHIVEVWVKGEKKPATEAGKGAKKRPTSSKKKSDKKKAMKKVKKPAGHKK